MKFVGLTGGIGSGKSTVRGLLAARGAVTLDVDEITRELQQPGQPYYERIVARWGPAVVAVDGRLDRAALAEIVFRDRAQLEELTMMAAAFVEAEIVRRAMAHHDDPDAIVVLESALFRGLSYGMTGLVVVDAPVDVAVDRLVRSRGFDEADARARVAAQAPREERLRHAGFVVVNAGSPDDLEAQMDPLIEWIRSLPDATPTLDRRTPDRPSAHPPG